MINKLGSVFIFAIGAAIGSVVTWRFVKAKYERIAKEEIESVKEVFSKRTDPIRPLEEGKTKLETLENYSDTLKTLQYNINESKVPYIIDPGDLGNGEFDYDLISLNYYSDGVLTDDFDIEIANAEEIVGTESLSLFGDPEQSTVYVRNDKLKAEYEIVYCDEKFSDIVQNSPQDEEEEEE